MSWGLKAGVRAPPLGLLKREKILPPAPAARLSPIPQLVAGKAQGGICYHWQPFDVLRLAMSLEKYGKRSLSGIETLSGGSR